MSVNLCVYGYVQFESSVFKYSSLQLIKYKVIWKIEGKKPVFLHAHRTRAGSVTPVSQCRDQFTSIPLRHFTAVFRMSAYNIVRKRKVEETNLKSEEIANFYPIF